MTRPIRVLCLDIEGGYGGSSRSLFETVRHMDRGAVAIEVWCKKDGPIRPRYEALGIPCRIVPDMPRVSALPRLSRNLYTLAGFALSFLRSHRFRAALAAEIESRFDLVHFNHEALHMLMAWLRARTHAPFVMHVRTNLQPSIFARLQTRIMARSADRLVFITEHEQNSFRRNGGMARRESVIANIVTPPERVSPHPDVPADSRFRVACLSNYSWVRGLDRLVDVAEKLKALGRTDVLFVMAGTMALTRSMPGELGRLGAAKKTLADYAALRGVADSFLFLGHVAEPERVLSACHALAKPSRENNPWGRDALEGMAMGLPVLACGTYSKFVEDGVTGVLQPEFDADALARAIARMADDRAYARRLGETGRARVLTLCDGTARATDLLAVWREAARA